VVCCPDRSGQQNNPAEPMSKRDINDVLRDYDQKLMALHGVVGVCVGLLQDKKSSCLKVMVVRETEDLKRKIPKSLDGYPVLIEETGVVRPLPSKTYEQT
jgi:hypothetical protein